MRTITCLALGVSLALAGCKKPKPSLEYTEAKGLHSTLVAKHGDDAYADPEMDRVLELLSKVPAESLDNTAARELEGFIASERKRIADEAAAHERLMNAVDRPPEVPGTSPPVRPPDEGQPEVDTADAGGPAPGEPQPGMTVDEVRRLTQDCFASAGTVKLKRGDQQADGEMYERVDSGNCRFRYPTYAGRILVFQDGRMMGAYDKAQLSSSLRPGGGQGGGPAGAGGGPAAAGGGPAGAGGGPAAPTPPPPPNITPAPPQNELPKPPTTPGEQTGPGQQY